MSQMTTRSQDAIKDTETPAIEIDDTEAAIKENEIPPKKMHQEIWGKVTFESDNHEIPEMTTQGQAEEEKECVKEKWECAVERGKHDKEIVADVMENAKEDTEPTLYERIMDPIKETFTTGVDYIKKIVGTGA